MHRATSSSENAVNCNSRVRRLHHWKASAAAGVIAQVSKELQEMRDSGVEERMAIWAFYGSPEAHAVKPKKRKTPAGSYWSSIPADAPGTSMHKHACTDI